MRIAHVTDCYLPRLGGIEMQVRALAAHQLAADPSAGHKAGRGRRHLGEPAARFEHDHDLAGQELQLQ